MRDLVGQVEAARQRWNAGDLDGYLDLYNGAMRLHGYTPEPMGKAEATAFYEMVWATLAAPGKPNPELQYHETLVDGNMYSCRFTMSGVHGGEFLAVPASGMPYALSGITIMRFDGPRVVERWSTVDVHGMMLQIGATLGTP
jgi:predicted ester cyclase